MAATCRWGAAISACISSLRQAALMPTTWMSGRRVGFDEREPGGGGLGLELSGALHGSQRASPPWPKDSGSGRQWFHRRCNKKHERRWETVASGLNPSGQVISRCSLARMGKSQDMRLGEYPGEPSGFTSCSHFKFWERNAGVDANGSEMRRLSAR